MTLGIDYAKRIREDARLIILRALAEQINETLASNVIQEDVLPVFAIRQDRDWVHVQLDWLANVGVITVTPASTVRIATLTNMGRQHLDRDIAVQGITRPSRPGG
ncbi:MAG: hypothetical protein KDK08_27865 [Rhizobiaceae bacterium]|nr:hypothetical protein [Rhizobiaceae bacterium]